MSGAAKKEEKKGDAAVEKRFEEWMVKYGKVYKDAAEKNKRFQIFKRNWEKCESHNASNKGWTMCPYRHSDLNKDEVPPFVGELPYEIPPTKYPLINYSFAAVMDGSSSFKKALKETILSLMSRKPRK